MSVLSSAAHHAAALAMWPAAQRALGWPLALALTLAWLAAAERATRRRAVLEAQRDWEARPFFSPLRTCRSHPSSSLLGSGARPARQAVRRRHPGRVPGVVERAAHLVRSASHSALRLLV